MVGNPAGIIIHGKERETVEVWARYSRRFREAAMGVFGNGKKFLPRPRKTIMTMQFGR